MPTFGVGAVLHWKAFDKDRPSGAQVKNKYLVVLGAKQGKNALLVLATTQKHKKLQNPGCSAKEGYYYIPAVAKEFFKEDTWLLLNEPKETDAAELIKKGLAKEVEAVGKLSAAVTQALIACLKNVDDVSDLHRMLV